MGYLEVILKSEPLTVSARDGAAIEVVIFVCDAEQLHVERPVSGVRSIRNG
jgi:hypothetical protein